LTAPPISPPHLLQNRAPAGGEAPQEGHLVLAIELPQFEQNRPDASRPQFGHFIDSILGI
jgi:hypothetical protein